MADALDAARFPRAARHLAGLPLGWQSYPDCGAHSDTFDRVRSTHPELGTLAGVPEILRRVVHGEGQGEWVPECVGCGLFLVARDALFQDDEAFLQWCGESARHSFNRPWARVVMLVLSPTLVVMGAAKRWSSFHRGTTLTPEPAVREAGRMVVRADLAFPHSLFDGLTLRRWGTAYEVALSIAKATAPRVTLSDPTPTSARYSVSWQV